MLALLGLKAKSRRPTDSNHCWLQSSGGCLEPRTEQDSGDSVSYLNTKNTQIIDAGQTSTFLILKIIFSKKRKGETNPPQRATDKKRRKEGRGKRKEWVKRQGRRQKSYHSPTVSALVPNVQTLKFKSAHKALHDFFKHDSPRWSVPLQLAMLQPTTNVSLFSQSICNFTLALITSWPRKVCLLFCDVLSSAPWNPLQKTAFR